MYVDIRDLCRCAVTSHKYAEHLISRCEEIHYAARFVFLVDVLSIQFVAISVDAGNVGLGRTVYTR